MREVLYRKYRSKSLDEIVGQEHITKTLANAVKSGNISHAYLFTGPRGVGKTSIARILAHQVNELDYNEENRNHLDIIEIDAASNRRIDEIRELRDKINIAPTSAKFKVYIIDEVHMLTKEAFNALLKTLEEPPEHAIFILATTESHKLPETIVSRTQKFTFRPISAEKVAAHLKNIADQESITVDDEALSLIAEHGEGSFRDSISLLDQLRSHADKITAEQVRQIVGSPPKNEISKLANEIQNGNYQSVSHTIKNLFLQGYEPTKIASGLSAHMRSQIEPNNLNYELLHQLISVSASRDPRLSLELILLQASAAQSTQTQAEPIADVVVDKKPAAESIKPKAATKPINSDNADKPSGSLKNAKAVPKVEGDSVEDLLKNDLWPKTLEQLKGQYNTLYGIARMAQAIARDNQLVLKLQFPFHARRLNEKRNMQRVSDVVESVCGKRVVIKCEIDDKKNPQPNKPESEQKNPKQNNDTAQPAGNSGTLETVTNIFGGGEVME